MEEKFVLLRLKLAEIWEVSDALTAALYILVDKEYDKLPDNYYNTVKKLRDKLWKACADAI